jgi:hypothetical protein
MTIRELLKELLKDELRLDDEIRFYYMKQDELIGCEVESIAYRDQVEFTIFDDLQTTDFHNPSSKVSNE